MTQPTLFEREVLPKLEAKEPDFLGRCRLVAERLGRTGRFVTINDVRKEIGGVPEGVEPRTMGAVFERSKWRNEGYTASDRKTSHGRPVARFRLKTMADGRRAEEAARSVFAGETHDGA